MSSTAKFRVSRIKYAAASSIGSKVVTILVQLLAMPVAIRALGAQEFALYALLASAIGWVGLVNLGVGPALSVSMASAVANNDRTVQARLCSSGFFPVLGVVVALGGILLSLAQTPRVDGLFGENYLAQADTIRTGLSLLLVFALAQALLSVAEAAQIGYQEQYVFNIWAIFGNLVSLFALFATAWRSPTVIAMILAVNLPPLLARLLNAARFLSRRPFLIPRISTFSWQAGRFLIGNGLIFSLAASVGNFLNHQYTVILVGRAESTQITTTFAVMMNVFILAFGLVTMLAIPLWPAIADSVTRGEIDWAHLAYRKMLLYSMLYSLAVCLGLILFGPIAFPIWFSADVNPNSRLLLLAGVYFVLDTWEYVHFMVLIGLKQIWRPSVLYLLRSLMAVLIAPALIGRFGESGAFAALSFSILMTTAWAMPYLVRSVFKWTGQTVT